MKSTGSTPSALVAEIIVARNIAHFFGNSSSEKNALRERLGPSPYAHCLASVLLGDLGDKGS
jgi:hypothetical protein